MNRDEYFGKLANLFDRWFEANLVREVDESKREVLKFIANNPVHICEFCNGRGDFDRDNSDGVAVYWECEYCAGTGIDYELETK